jgi:hypothetical protein
MKGRKDMVANPDLMQFQSPNFNRISDFKFGFNSDLSFFLTNPALNPVQQACREMFRVWGLEISIYRDLCIFLTKSI